MRQSLVDRRENQRSIAGKEPPFGHVDIFQTWPMKGTVKIDIMKSRKGIGEPPTRPSAGGAFALYERFAPGKISAEGRLRRPEHFNAEGWRPPLAAGTQNKRQLLSQLPFVLVRLEGFEPATFWFVAKHSIQLSYSRNSFPQGALP